VPLHQLVQRFLVSSLRLLKQSPFCALSLGGFRVPPETTSFLFAATHFAPPVLYVWQIPPSIASLGLFLIFSTASKSQADVKACQERKSPL
jgi:hypothetical protein